MPKLMSCKSTATAITSGSSPPPPPPWEVLVLLAHHLDPKTLAVGSCVSTSWQSCMSLDHIWESFCSTHYPSISQLKLANRLIPYHRLYAMAYTAAKRREKKPPKPQLSLDKLIFVVTITTKDGRHSIVSTAKPGSELDQNKHNGVFRFDIDVNNSWYIDGADDKHDVKISWNVVAEGWSEVFCMMDLDGKVGRINSSSGGEGWFSAELPRPECWLGDDAMNSGIVADVKLKFSSDDDKKGEKWVRVDKVSVGIMSTVNWRYVCIENGLRYLQQFLVS
ncbi:probable F-box protein At5g04010 [Mercurialis annua]|uniref:probable F-box protein At5g04010 n=1 Tax=Mercurialis annua TaxID=3986 RepID=UPI00215EF1ED|nr:probable F-box protein At5g04010 [Mercurialis annua]